MPRPRDFLFKKCISLLLVKPLLKDIQAVIGLLRDRGEMAMLLVEQFFEFARDLADTFAVLNRREVILAGTGDSMDEAVVRRLMTV